MSPKCKLSGILAEGVGFEPTDACTSPVFKTGALDRSATLPEKGKLYRKFPSMREFVWLEFDRSVSNVCSRLNGQLTKSIRLKAGHTDCACKQVAFSDRQASQNLQSSGEKQVSCHAFGVMFSEEAVSSFLAEFLNCAL